MLLPDDPRDSPVLKSIRYVAMWLAAILLFAGWWQMMQMGESSGIFVAKVAASLLDKPLHTADEWRSWGQEIGRVFGGAIGSVGGFYAFSHMRWPEG